jgi:hypothetical protein
VLFSPDAWRAAAGCFLEGSLRQRAGLSIAASRTLPGQPPTLVGYLERVSLVSPADEKPNASAP